MEHVSVKLPTQLENVIKKKAKTVGVTKSEKIRNDLIEKYEDELENGH